MTENSIYRGNVGTVDLDVWREAFWSIYSEQDTKRDLHQVWAMAYEDATRVGEAIREDNLRACLNALAHSFCWIACFVTKLGTDPSIAERFRIPRFRSLVDVVFYKFPNYCPSCYQPACECVVKDVPKLSHQQKRAKLDGLMKDQKDNLPNTYEDSLCQYLPSF